MFNSTPGFEWEKYKQMEAEAAEQESKEVQCPTPATGGAGQQLPPRPPSPPLPSENFNPDPENFEFLESAFRHNITREEMIQVIRGNAWTPGRDGALEARGIARTDGGSRYIETAFRVRENNVFTTPARNYDQPLVVVHHAMVTTR